MPLKKSTSSNFLIRLKSWEYWPFGILQFPVFIYWLWLSLRSRSLMFFTASNPGITMGGMFGESKYDVLKKIPEQYVPKTILIHTPITSDQLQAKIYQAGFNLPVIFKPDIGERGYLVKRIKTNQEIADYLSVVKQDFLVQELVDMPHEFGVFYTRKPNDLAGKVTSVVLKEMLTVTGDGQSTLQELILSKERAKLQWKKLREVYKERLNEILPTDKVIELVSIGNHCLGTTFLDGSHLINPTLSKTFDSISQQIDGFYFGRFDLRCESLDALYEGRIKVMELNGCGAEPAHIYHPGNSILKAMGVLLIHWRNIFLIARENRKRGVPYATLEEGLFFFRKFKAATKST